MSDAGVPPATDRSAQRPTWIELDQDALARNVTAMVEELSGVPLMAVVKANAYGHGAVPVARSALRNGASWVATATISEGLELRHDGIAAPILVLGYTPPEQVPAAVAGRLAITVFDQEVLAALERAGADQGRPATAHVKVDTGMSRLGVAGEELAGFVEMAQPLRHVELEGCYTHFRKGEDRAVTTMQLARFLAALKSAEAAGHHFRLRHAANSAAWKAVPESRLDLVRSGIELLGMRTTDGRQREPVLSFHATVAQVRSIDAGTYVGYDDIFQAERPMVVATLSVGYGDGFRRGPQNWGSVSIAGRERALVGTVGMDLCMVDVTEPPAVQAGAIATLIGHDGDVRLSAEIVAERLGTINYEVTSALLGRIPREPRSGPAAPGPEYN